MDEATWFGPFRVLVFQEEGVWLAQAVDYEICVQASDQETLRLRFWRTVAGEILTALQLGDREPLDFGVKVLERFVDRYDAAERRALETGSASDG